MRSLLNHVRTRSVHSAYRGGTHLRRLCFLMAALLLLATQLAAPAGRSLAATAAKQPSSPTRIANAQGAGSTPDIATLDFNGTGGAWANDVVVKGTTAYLFENNKLIILNVQNPAKPEWLGEYRFEKRPEGSFFHFDVANSHVYLPLFPNGMQIIDVSNPRQPSLCGEYKGLSYVYDVKVINSVAYVAGEHFHILDVHNPCVPTLLGSDPGWAWKIVVSNGRAYLETQSDGITIIDVTNPAVPVKLGTYAEGGSDLAVVGTRLYIARDGLLIVDVSDPTAPTLLNRYQALGGVLSLDVVGSLAYVGVSGKVGIIDVSNPATPIVIGSYAPISESLGIQISGSFAYVAASIDDLRIIDVSNPMSPQLSANYITLKNPGRVFVEGTRAYVGGSRLDILDVSDLHNPKLISDYQPVGNDVEALKLIGDLAYVAGGKEFEIINIHDPAQPTLVGRYSLPNNPMEFSSMITHVDVVGTRAYLSLKGGTWEDVRLHGKNGLLVLDISNPAAPIPLGSYITDAPANDIQVVGQYAYLAVGHVEQYYPGGLITLNITDPSHPTLVGSYLMTADANDLQVVGNLVYLLDAYKGLNILDVSDPAHPRRIGLFIRTLGYPPIMAIQVDGPVAYLMASDIEVLNVSDPTRPTLHSVFPARLFITDMQMVGDHLFTVNGEELSIYHIERDQASAEITPSGGSLVNQIKTIEMTVPPDAVDTTAVISYTGFLGQTQPVAEDQRIVRNFAIDTDQQSKVNLADFGQPYTMELRYNELQLSAALAQESTLAVAVRDGDSWTELPPTSYTVDTANNRVTLTGTQAREYALVGRSAHIFLPLAGR